VPRIAPPSGSPPPATAPHGDGRIELRPLAETVVDRYFTEFPEDLSRYGEVARPWAIHDTLYILQWALLDVAALADVAHELNWLADVLAARDFPLDHLRRNAELCADVLAERHATAAAERLRAWASSGSP
jgi:hypothetical protein